MARFSVSTHISSKIRHACLLGALAIPAYSAIASGAALAQDQLELTIQGTLEANCELFGQNGDFQGLDLSSSGEKTLSINVDCNAPFSYAIVSENGALLHSDASTPGETMNGLAQDIVYNVSTSFALDDGGSFGDSDMPSEMLDNAYAASCLGPTYQASCPFSNSGSGTSAANSAAHIKVEWDRPDAPRLAGTYTDTLRLTVRVK